MSSDSNPRSLLKLPAGQPVGHLTQQQLTPRITSTKGEGADVSGIQIDLGADQAIWPRSSHIEAVSQQLHGPFLPGPSQVDDPAAWRGLQIQVPTLGERSSGRSRLD